MTVVVYFFASLFVVLSVLMFWSYRRLRHYGLFVMGLTYGSAGTLAFLLNHWWPLAAGFAMVWALKLVGLNPDADILGSQEEGSRRNEEERPR